MKPNAGNNGDIDSGKSKIHPVVVFDFRYTHPPILQEISLQTKQEGERV